MPGIRTLIIDNYDSFTFNLYHLVGRTTGEEPIVVCNDEAAWEEIAGLPFDNIVISPGPGTPARPRDFGVCGDAILKTQAPLLGVCLGHQGIGFCFGAEIVRAPEPMHGRVSCIRHNGLGLFAGVPQEFRATRYHSLMVGGKLPGCLRATAWASDGVLMGLTHMSRPLFGVQFHPESIASEYGDELLENFRDLTPRNAVSGYSRTTPDSARQQHNETDQRGDVSVAVHSRKIPFDTSRTAEVFSILYGREQWAFWLDSSRTDIADARFSFMGDARGPLSEVVTYDCKSCEITLLQGAVRQTIRKHIYDYLQEKLRERRCHSGHLPFDFNCGFVGYIGYEMKSCTGATVAHISEYPDSAFLFADRMIAFDHRESQAWLVSYGPADEAEQWFNTTECILATLSSERHMDVPQEPSDVVLQLGRRYRQYLADIARCLEFIRAGESYEMCLTNWIWADAICDPIALYCRLREANPAPFSAFLRFGDTRVLSCSPERFLRITRERMMESKPIKGTRPRAGTLEADEELRRDLISSEKDRSEHLMIVDLLRNDIGRVSEMGSVHVAKMMDIESYATVHQMVSTVRGRMRPGMDALSCLRAVFPGGSMTGAPKLRTMELLDSIEGVARGIYSGCSGFLSLAGTADFNIIIRTVVCTSTHTSIGIGGAVVALSDPEAEFDETLVKARALIRALLIHSGKSADPHVLDRLTAELRQNGVATA